MNLCPVSLAPFPGIPKIANQHPRIAETARESAASPVFSPNPAENGGEELKKLALTSNRAPNLTSAEMFGSLSHSVFETEIKIEPISFYGCSSSSPDAQPAPLDENPEQRKKRKPQACKVCGKILSSTSSYYVHMKLHSGNKPFQCSQCDACFCRKPYLEVHLRTHTGERPFKCDVCEKRFTQKSSLNTHKRVHTGLRPYACDLCEKKFAVKSYLVAHRWSHISEGLNCPECNAVFSTKSQFVQHVKSHNSRRGFECGVCHRRFVRDSYLIRHQNKVHKNNA